jgi:hypothetical protein
MRQTLIIGFNCVSMREYRQVRDERNELEEDKKLLEEKRRLLTCIIEQLIEYLCYKLEHGTVFISSILDDVIRLAEFHKRVNSAMTIDDLAKISEELVKFKK